MAEDNNPSLHSIIYVNGINILSPCSSTIFISQRYFFSGQELKPNYIFHTLERICIVFYKCIFMSLASVTGSGILKVPSGSC